MFGVHLDILQQRENLPIPSLIVILCNHIDKIPYNVTTHRLNSSQSTKLEHIKNELRLGNPIVLNEYDNYVCTHLIQYFISKVPGTSTQFNNYIINFVHKKSLPENYKEILQFLYQSKNIENIHNKYNLSTSEIRTNKLVSYKDLKNLIPLNTPKNIRILSLDGGGMRCIFSIKMLIIICRHIYGSSDEIATKKFISRFDLIAGTSGGAIIAAALSIGYSLDSIKDLFYTLGTDIFGMGWKDLLPSLYKYYKNGDYYSSEKLIEFLIKHFNDNKMFELNNKLCIVSTSTITNIFQPYLFRSYDNHNSKYNGCKNITLVNAVKASTSAPTYFCPYVDEYGDKYIDGGVVANNPTEIAIFEGYHLWPDANINFILSIGTGKLKVTSGTLNLKGLSVELLNMLTNSEITHNRLLEWIRDYATWMKYYRFSPEDLGSLPLDTINPNILSNGEILTERYMDSMSKQLDEIKKYLY